MPNVSSMKKAVIVVGKANAGKSTTIREFKKLVKVKGRRHVFILNRKWGYILSCSFEEKDWPITATIQKRAHYDYLVLACQGPMLNKLHSALKRVSFRVADVHVQAPREGAAKAKKVLSLLKSP